GAARAGGVRTGACLLARLRGARTWHHQWAFARRARDPPAGAAQADRHLWRRGERSVRCRDRVGRPRFPALALRQRGWHRRTAHPRGALRRRRRISPSHALRGGRRQVVSSILDALEKLERTRPPTIEPVPVVVPPPRRTRVILLVGSAFAAGAVLAVGLLRSRPATTPQVVPPPADAPEAKQLPTEPVEPVAAPSAPAAPAQEAIPPKLEPVSAPPPPPPPQPPPPPTHPAQRAPGPAASPVATAPVADAPHAPAPEVLAAARPVPPPSPAGPRPWAQPAAPPPPAPTPEVSAPPRPA